MHLKFGSVNSPQATKLAPHQFPNKICHDKGIKHKNVIPLFNPFNQTNITLSEVFERRRDSPSHSTERGCPFPRQTGSPAAAGADEPGRGRRVEPHPGPPAGQTGTTPASSPADCSAKQQQWACSAPVKVRTAEVLKHSLLKGQKNINIQRILFDRHIKKHSKLL